MRVACPHCGREYDVKDELAGRKARCSNPACKQGFVLPAPPPPAQKPALPAGAAGQIPTGVLIGPAPGAPAPGAVPGTTSGTVPVSGPLDALLTAELGSPAAPGAAPGATGPWAAPGTIPQPGMAAPVAGPLGGPLGPPAYLYRRRRTWVRPALIGAGASAAVALVVLVVIVVARGLQGGGAVSQATGGSGVASNGLPAWAAFCALPDAKAVAYVNIDKIRESGVLRTIEELANKMGEKPFNFEVGAAPLKDFLLVGGPEVSVGVLRTRDDLSLETISAALSAAGASESSAGKPNILTHAGVSYVRYRSGYVAKLGSCMYCASDRESGLKAALDRHQRGEAPPLAATLAEALKNAPSGDHFLAMIPGDVSDMQANLAVSAAGKFAKEVRWLVAAGYIGSSIRGTVAIEFQSSEPAAKMKADFDDAQKQLSARLGQAPPQIRQKMQTAADMLNRVRMSQSGQRVQITFDWQVATLANLLDTFGP